MNNIIVFLIIIIVLVMFFKNKINEGFDLTVNLQQYPRVGKFDDLYQIGTRTVWNVAQCKDICNKMESCAGISYRGRPFYECRLYNDTTDLYYDPRYLSWRNFWNKIY